MIDCLREREKRDFSNRDYVYCQFTNKRLKTRYKNVFIHTSLIEGLIVDRSLRKESQVRQKCECCGREDSFRSFRRAIEISYRVTQIGSGVPSAVSVAAFGAHTSMRPPATVFTSYWTSPGSISAQAISFSSITGSIGMAGR